LGIFYNWVSALLLFVVDSIEFEIIHVLQFFNLFTTKSFDLYNRPATNPQVKTEIFTVSGRLIKTISPTINTMGNRSNEIE
jgi:hypothetical protein